MNSPSSDNSEPCHAETVATSLVEQINVGDIKNMVSVQREMCVSPRNVCGWIRPLAILLLSLFLRVRPLICRTTRINR